MSAPPFMQMYWSDYFGDTRHLNCEQHGAYLQLIGSMWQAGGSLPSDARKLAQVTGLSASRWAKISDDVLAFFEIDGGRLTHKRVTAELEKANEKSSKRAEAGARGGLAKSLKTQDASQAIARGLPEHSSDTDTDTELEGSNEPPNHLVLVPPARPFAEVDHFAIWWAAYPRKVAKPAAIKAYAAAIRRLGPNGHARLLTGIETSGVAQAREAQFIPHPATWLTGDRWNDQPTPMTSPAPRGAFDAPRLDPRLAAREENHNRAFTAAQAVARQRAERD